MCIRGKPCRDSLGLMVSLEQPCTANVLRMVVLT